LGHVSLNTTNIYAEVDLEIGYTETGLSSLKEEQAGKEMTSCVVAPSGTLHQK
jgi:hypothetical protein